MLVTSSLLMHSVWTGVCRRLASIAPYLGVLSSARPLNSNSGTMGTHARAICICVDVHGAIAHRCDESNMLKLNILRMTPPP